MQVDGAGSDDPICMGNTYNFLTSLLLVKFPFYLLSKFQDVSFKHSYWIFKTCPANGI